MTSSTFAVFNSPQGVSIDSSGNIYVADTYNHIIRKITSVGVVTTLAGSGTGKFIDGTGKKASFNQPFGIAIDSSGNIYVADTYNHRIRKITSVGVVTTLAGSGIGEFADGTGKKASFKYPRGVAVDSSGNIYLADQNNNIIRKITSGGIVTTLAGSGTGTFADGTGKNASFYGPYGVAVDSSGNVYVADTNNQRIRKITSGGVVTTLAGSGTGQFADGTGKNASFNYPYGVAVDSSGNIYVGDWNNNIIRKITSGGIVTTLAGSGTGEFSDGTGTNASFNYPLGVAVDSSGNVYVADQNNNIIRKITSVGVVTTLAGSGTFNTNAKIVGLCPPPARSCRFLKR
jgi:sugar lactone lactonase YvrE